MEATKSIRMKKMADFAKNIQYGDVSLRNMTSECLIVNNKGFGMSREDLNDRMFFLKPGETKILTIKVLTPVSGKFKYRIEYIGLGAAEIVDYSPSSIRDVFAKFWRSRWNAHNVEIDVMPN